MAMQDILCNDCDKKSASRFHWLYHKCRFCGSYNTRVIKTEATNPSCPQCVLHLTMEAHRVCKYLYSHSNFPLVEFHFTHDASELLPLRPPYYEFVFPEIEAPDQFHSCHVQTNFLPNMFFQQTLQLLLLLFCFSS